MAHATAMTSSSVPTKVADIMTRRLITVSEEDTLEHITAGMEKYRFRHLPVVRGNRLVGLVTHRDMLQLSASSLSSQREIRDRLIHQVPVGRIMRTEVATVSPGDSLLAAGKLMWEMKVGCLCVTNDDDVLLGIVTEADFVRLALTLIRHIAPPQPPSKAPSKAPSDAPGETPSDAPGETPSDPSDPPPNSPSAPPEA